MKYQEAVCQDEFPEMTEVQRGLFLHVLANLDEHIVYVNSKGVIEDKLDGTTWVNTAYLVNWKWKSDIFMDIARGTGNPDPHFVQFIADYAIRMGIFEYEDSEFNRKEFEEVMAGRCSFTRLANSDKPKYAFQAELAFTAWMRAHNRGRIDDGSKTN